MTRVDEPPHSGVFTPASFVCGPTGCATTFRITPSGHVYIANLVEGLIATASPWGGAGYRLPDATVGPV